jgi:hypothetical protein
MRRDLGAAFGRNQTIRTGNRRKQSEQRLQRFSVLSVTSCSRNARVPEDKKIDDKKMGGIPACRGTLSSTNAAQASIARR